ncbi:MAG: low molecular weight protein-tyrosine-phosphatase [Christensenellales bacterium]
MKKIMFVCHGNICRSPMAEFVTKNKLKERNIQAVVESSATSTEEIGNAVHYGTKKILDSLGIDCSGKRARQFSYADYQKFDYIVGMDEYNVRNLRRMTGADPLGKVSKLLQWADSDDDVADPWYTGDFEKTYQDIELGCTALLDKIFGI